MADVAVTPRHGRGGPTMFPGWEWFSVRVDWVHLARGASLCFSVLVIGGLSAPLASRIPLIGPAWLIITAVVAFVAAGYRIGDAAVPRLHGAAAAVAGYLLVLPLVAMATRSLDPVQLGLTTLTAVLMGGLAGHFAGRNRARRQSGG
ncbi:hypothetical protein LWC33_15530 [Pseudonocardia sp. RS11V-5]|uniref:hypothetical protein n=1 Tax=Pseudonocardia terrae TaxID=2905831 RepID=UPI001E430399|nr:hypothetical protein [Pseudonocardia terrae]MCE3552863.1 hypothetical protein [Pseudonocardia terrae]